MPCPLRCPVCWLTQIKNKATTSFAPFGTGLHYRNDLMEKKFMVERVRGDGYYRTTKWMLLALAMCFATYAVTMVRTALG